jgi:hypothetical protein
VRIERRARQAGAGSAREIRNGLLSCGSGCGGIRKRGLGTQRQLGQRVEGVLHDLCGRRRVEDITHSRSSDCGTAGMRPKGSSQTQLQLGLGGPIQRLVGMDIAGVEVHERGGTVGEAFKGGSLLVRNIELSSELDGRGYVLADARLQVLIPDQ